jgi:hypothetical protein
MDVTDAANELEFVGSGKSGADRKVKTRVTLRMESYEITWIAS